MPITCTSLHFGWPSEVQRKCQKMCRQMEECRLITWKKKKTDRVKHISKYIDSSNTYDIDCNVKISLCNGCVNSSWPCNTPRPLYIQGILLHVIPTGIHLYIHTERIICTHTSVHTNNSCRSRSLQTGV